MYNKQSALNDLARLLAKKNQKVRVPDRPPPGTMEEPRKDNPFSDQPGSMSINPYMIGSIPSRSSGDWGLRKSQLQAIARRLGI